VNCAKNYYDFIKTRTLQTGNNYEWLVLAVIFKINYNLSSGAKQIIMAFLCLFQASTFEVWAGNHSLPDVPDATLSFVPAWHFWALHVHNAILY
jgi:hypothetical protein